MIIWCVPCPLLKGYARKRLASIDYLDTALEKFELESPDNLSRIANLKYQRGYIKSTTQKYRSAAKEDLYEALKIWNVQPEREYEIDMVKDHLGYVLSDQPEHYEEAERYLRAACSSRERRLEMNPSTQNQKDYATTCDNLGCLLMVSDPTALDTGAYLEKALRIRDSILNQEGGNETDVAWTAFNYGKYLFYVKHDLPGAERNLSRSLTLRREQNRIHKGFYSTNVIFTDVTLAKILSYDQSRMDDVSDYQVNLLQAIRDNSDTAKYANLLLLDTAGIYEDESSNYISPDDDSAISYYMYSSQRLERDAEKYSNASVVDYYEQICSYLKTN